MATLFFHCQRNFEAKKAMANEIQEFFLGQNEQEIENERRKTRALMKLFPYSMGNTDQTKYILRKDGNQNQNESLGSNAIDKPGKVVISNESEKSQEQNWEQIPKVTDFVNRNIETPFASNGFTQADSLSEFNNTNRAGVFDATGKHDKVHRTTPRHEANRGLEPDSIFTNDHSDLLWSNRKQERTYYNQEPGIYGVLPTKNYSKQINELKSQLPQRMLRILNELGTEIRVLDNLHYVDKDGNIKQPLGTYHSNKITLDSKHVDIETLLTETIHAVQDYLGMADKGLSNLEFQEHVLKDLYNIQSLIQKGSSNNGSGISTSNNESYMDFIKSVFSDNGVLDLNEFLINIDSFFDEFQKNFKKSKSYQVTGINNFNYNWIHYLNILGIQYK